MGERKRFDELDIMKGIGITLIVIGHLEPGTYLMRFVYSFHLFLFFMCSGFVGTRYVERCFVEIVKGNVKRLLLPYLVWSILSQFVDLLFGIIDFGQAARNILFLDANVGWNAALWFLVSLFWADTICALIVRLIRWAQFIAGGVVIMLWMLFAVSNVSIFWGLYTVPVAAIFWLFGYWMNVYGIHEKMMKNNICLIISGGVLLVVNICCGVIFNQVISIYHIRYYNIPLTIVAGIAGVLFLMPFSILLNNNGKFAGILIFYGKNTLTILCTHYFILRLIGTVSKKLIGHNLWRYTSTPKSIFLAVMVIVAYYPILIGIGKLKEKYL